MLIHIVRWPLYTGTNTKASLHWHQIKPLSINSPPDLPRLIQKPLSSVHASPTYPHTATVICSTLWMAFREMKVFPTFDMETIHCSEQNFTLQTHVIITYPHSQVMKLYAVEMSLIDVTLIYQGLLGFTITYIRTLANYLLVALIFVQLL